MKLVPQFSCTKSGILEAYRYKDFVIDGLLFYNKESHYECGTVTPLVLLWKDENCCRYWKNILSSSTEQRVHFIVDNEGYLRTSDEKVIGKVKEEDVKKFELKPMDIVKVQLTIENESFKDLKLLSKAKGRYHADSWSKLIFYYNAPRKHITIDSLIATSEKSNEQSFGHTEEDDSMKL